MRYDSCTGKSIRMKDHMILILLKQAFTAIHAVFEALVEKRKSYGLAICVEK